MIRLYILILLLFSCTDLLINNLEYHSVELKGNAWIEVNQGSNFNANDFTIQSWFSGSDTTLNRTQTIISILNSSRDILIGIFKDPTYPNHLDIWIDNEHIETVEILEELNNIDKFNLITLSGEATVEFICDGGFNEGTACDGLYDTETCGDLGSCISDSKIAISIYLNKTNIFNNSNPTLKTGDLSDINFAIGGMVSDTYPVTATSFWHGCIDEIRLWNTVLPDSMIVYHNDYPYKLSYESDSLSYINHLGHLSGLWRFYSDGETYSIVANDACSSIERLYNDDPCSTDAKATIYTYGYYSTVLLSEKHK